MTLSFDFAACSGLQRYKLLTGLVVPRPIALITTISEAGVVNAAPFSFFNVFSESPPLVVVGLQAKLDGSVKDTTRNVRTKGHFVVHMVDEAFATAMAHCSINFPADIGEPEALNLALANGVHGPVPYLAGAPAALECRQVTAMNFGAERDLLVGEILGLHVRDGVVDAETLRTNYDAYWPIGRIGGNVYVRMGDRFELNVPSLEAWQSASG